MVILFPYNGAILWNSPSAFLRIVLIADTQVYYLKMNCDVVIDARALSL